MPLAVKINLKFVTILLLSPKYSHISEMGWVGKGGKGGVNRDKNRLSRMGGGDAC